MNIPQAGGIEIRCLAKAKQLEAVVECIDQWDLIPLPEYTYTPNNWQK